MGGQGLRVGLPGGPSGIARRGARIQHIPSSKGTGWQDTPFSLMKVDLEPYRICCNERDVADTLSFRLVE